MTREELEAIRRRAEAATPGPWTQDGVAVRDASDGCAGLGSRVCTTGEPADAEFIANARQDVPALLAYVAELEKFARLVLDHGGGSDATTDEFFRKSWEVLGETGWDPRSAVTPKPELEERARAEERRDWSDEFEDAASSCVGDVADTYRICAERLRENHRRIT